MVRRPTGIRPDRPLDTASDPSLSRVASRSRVRYHAQHRLALPGRACAWAVGPPVASSSRAHSNGLSGTFCFRVPAARDPTGASGSANLAPDARPRPPGDDFETVVVNNFVLIAGHSCAIASTASCGWQRLEEDSRGYMDGPSPASG